MMTDIDWVDSTVVGDIDKTFLTTFSRPEDSRLELQRLKRRGVHYADTSAVSDLWYSDISTKAELHESAVSRAQITIGSKGLTPESNAGTCAKCSIFAKNTHIHDSTSAVNYLTNWLAYTLYSHAYGTLYSPLALKSEKATLAMLPFDFGSSELVLVPEAN